MALEVEDGTAKVNAESYISVADATAYHGKRNQGDAWDNIDDKEAALRLATEYLQQMYGGRWRGVKVTATQRLDWPRAGVEMEDAPQYNVLANNVIPEEVKNACAELALRTASGALAPDLERAEQSVQVGSISVTYDPKSVETPRYQAVASMLSRYMNYSGNSLKLVRT